MIQDVSNDFIRFRISKDITRLFKDYLTILEDIRGEHAEMLNKLADLLPADYHDVLRAANYFTEEKAQTLRKRVLRAGNNASRDLMDELDKYNIEFKIEN